VADGVRGQLIVRLSAIGGASIVFVAVLTDTESFVCMCSDAMKYSRRLHCLHHSEADLVRCSAAFQLLQVQVAFPLAMCYNSDHNNLVLVGAESGYPLEMGSDSCYYGGPPLAFDRPVHLETALRRFNLAAFLSELLLELNTQKPPMWALTSFIVGPSQIIHSGVGLVKSPFFTTCTGPLDPYTKQKQQELSTTVL
jgi:hypothetical protein